MIYEFRTYTLKPASHPQVEKLFEENLPTREKYSKLTAFWHTEFGTLNQIIHVWEYESADERAAARADSAKEPNWPPPIGEFIVDMQSEIYIPFPGNVLTPGDHGPIYEMRSYMLKPGSIPGLIKVWEGAIEERAKMSPRPCALYTDTGPLNKFTHIWPYKSFDSRMEIRAEAVKSGKWPPATLEFIVKMENKVMLPASFSPMQ